VKCALNTLEKLREALSALAAQVVRLAMVEDVDLMNRKTGAYE